MQAIIIFFLIIGCLWIITEQTFVLYHTIPSKGYLELTGKATSYRCEGTACGSRHYFFVLYTIGDKTFHKETPFPSSAFYKTGQKIPIKVHTSRLDEPIVDSKGSVIYNLVLTAFLVVGLFLIIKTAFLE